MAEAQNTRPDSLGDQEAVDRESSLAEYEGSEIAIIGMACRFPGASTPEAFWRHLRDGVVVHDGVGDAVLVSLDVVHVDLLRQRARLQNPGRLPGGAQTRVRSTESEGEVCDPDRMSGVRTYRCTSKF